MNRKLAIGPRIAIYTILTLVCLICIIPIITVVSISLSTDMRIIKEGYGILPRGLTLAAYKYALKDGAAILRSYGVSIFVTVVGTVLGLLLNSMLAYVLARKNYRYQKQLTIFILIPMVLSGGMVPTYLWISSYLHLKNTVWVLILPLLVVPWFTILLRTFFTQIPGELMEAATVDGAGELTIFIKVMLPLAKPALLQAIPGAAALAYDSFLSFDNEQVEVDAVKKSEDGKYIVIRFHEFAGARQNVNMKTGFSYSSWAEGDLRERVTGEKHTEKEIRLEVKPYEIKTLLIEV